MKHIRHFARSILLLAVIVVTAAVHHPAFAVVSGVGVHFMNSPAIQGPAMQLMKSMGITSFRTDAHWSQIEPSPGVYRIPESWDHLVGQAIADGIEPVLILDYGNPAYDGGDKPVSDRAVQGYVGFAKFVVAHFKGKVRYYEIQNEWNGRLGGTTPGNTQDYARLVRATYPALKKIDPSAVILVGGGTEVSITDGWYDRLAALGALSSSDGISVHPYAYHGAVNGREGPELSWAWMDALRKRLASTGVHKQFYITEIGWPTNVGKFGQTEMQVANFYERTMLLASGTPWIGGVWWYDLSDDGVNKADKEHNFGLSQGNFQLKDAGRRAAAVNSFVSGHKIVALDVDPMKSTWTGVSARLAENKYSLVLWATTSQPTEVRIACDYFSTGSSDLKMGVFGHGTLQSVQISEQPKYVNAASLNCH